MAVIARLAPEASVRPDCLAFPVLCVGDVVPRWGNAASLAAPGVHSDGSGQVQRCSGSGRVSLMRRLRGEQRVASLPRSFQFSRSRRALVVCPPINTSCD